MKTRLTLTVIALFAISLISVEAQVGRLINRAVKAATKTTEKEVGKEANKASEQAVMNMFNRMRDANAAGDTTATGGAQGGGGLFGGGGMDLSALMGGGEVTIPYQEEYDFNGRIHMEMETFEKGEREGLLDYIIYFSASDLNSAIEMKNPDIPEDDAVMIMLFDFNNSAFLMITETEDGKAGLISRVTDDHLPDEDEIQEMEKDYESGMGKFEKTGRTKRIAGYNCDEYVAVDQEQEVEVTMWITDDLKLKVDKQGLATAGIPAWYAQGEYFGGSLMEMESREKGELTMRMITKEINENAGKKVSTNNIQLIQIGQ
jgi:hypothetical protein